jgi:sarcosine oxidase subunit beta
MVGLTIPIKPRRGQIIVTEACPPMVRHCLVSAKYIAAKYDPEIAKGEGEGISIEQTENGNFLLGSTREFVGYDKRTTPEGLRRIAAKTAGILPALAQVNVIRAFAGLRPYTPDGLPILGPVDDVSGFIMAAGHEGDGIALSPITGELIGQWIATGKSDIPLDAFQLNRFDAGRENMEAPHG